MKKKTFYNIVPLWIFLLWIIYGCDKHYLEIIPTDRISESALKKDSSLFVDFVINRYMGIRLVQKEFEGSPAGFGRGFEYAPQATITDEGMYGNDDGTWSIQRGQITSTNLSICGVTWGRSYRSIRECNWALTNINDVVMSEFTRNKLIAELKFIRAYRYFDLIKNYGGVVLNDDKVYTLESDFSDAAVYKRSSLQDCITYVLNELDVAASVLPLQPNSYWQKGRATKGAALALKARLLLYAASPLYTDGVNDPAKWSAAAAAAKAVMDLNIYSLHGNYSALFLSNTSSESIFSRYYVIGARHISLERGWGPNGYGGYGGLVPFQNLVDAYGMSNGLAIADPTSGYDPLNPYVNRDPRFYASILYNGAPYRGRNVETFIPGGLDSKDGPSNWNTSKTGYNVRKFMDDTNPIVNPNSVAGLQPWHYIRYAEVLLNYAEALNEASGPLQSVYDAINPVRLRAGIPALPAGLTQAEMRDRIRKERQVELAFEEHRYFDVRRWMIAPVTENVPGYGIQIVKSGATLTYSQIISLSGRSFAVKNYWLPIPREEILSSNGQLDQNEGF